MERGPGRQQSIRSQRVRHNCATWDSAHNSKNKNHLRANHIEAIVILDKH